MKFNLKQLEALVWVADLGSFRKAADRLNTTQPNISSRIASLETSLDLILMERDAGSVRLTAKGLEVLDHARSVLRASDNLTEAAGQDALNQGILRLGVTEMVAHTWLRQFLQHLKQNYPDVTVELTVDLSANLEKALFERAIDLAFQSGPFNRQTSANLELGIYPFIWVCSPSLTWPEKTQLTLEDLGAYPILTHARGTIPYDEVAVHIATRRDIQIRLVPSSNLAACILMAIDGFGSATVPAVMVKDELDSGQLSLINYPWTPQSLRFYARYDAEKSPQFVEKAAGLAIDITRQYQV